MATGTEARVMQLVPEILQHKDLKEEGRGHLKPPHGHDPAALSAWPLSLPSYDGSGSWCFVPEEDQVFGFNVMLQVGLEDEVMEEKPSGSVFSLQGPLMQI